MGVSGSSEDVLFENSERERGPSQDCVRVKSYAEREGTIKEQGLGQSYERRGE